MTAAYDDHIDLRGSDFHGSVSGKVEYHYHGDRAWAPVAMSALPAAPVNLIGRDDDLVRILPTLEPRAESGHPVVICAVSGLGGIGKTALALHAAHRADERGWFPGGTLFVDVAGYSERPLHPDQVVSDLLDALGIRGRDLPASSTARLALYRSQIFQAAGDSRRAAAVITNLGCALSAAGRLAEAVDALQDALELFRSTGDRRKEATVLTSLGATQGQMGRRDAAPSAYNQALDIWESLEDWHSAGDTLRNLALVHQDSRSLAAAGAAWARAATGNRPV
ncbi:tetratricopeptide repeat protein [Streptomyces tailanensis]|uniref:tetratricopeptide repeat protein n=1 Tax=Streptomyces tailanensis TaxID=2569858 RepID=UPI00122E86F1|nr:tetratricopeptide repeat protein [Streptomyces tailanensis]